MTFGQAADGCRLTWSAMADVEVRPEILAAIAERHGVRTEGVLPVASSGEANHVYLLGEDLILRIPRTEGFVADLRKEAVVIPIVRRVGVQTPDLVSFDDSGQLLGVPYMVLERVPGSDLGRAELPLDRVRPAMRALGRELAKLHSRTPATVAKLPGVPVDEGGGDPREVVDRLATNGYIDRTTAEWFSRWFDRLRERIPRQRPKVLLHGDLASGNILIDPGNGQLRALIDWGDAAWAEPGIEFAKLPLDYIAIVIGAYREVLGTAPEKDNASLEARAVWCHLSWRLAGLAHDSTTSDQPRWNGHAAARLLSVLRFFHDLPSEPWSLLR